MEKVTSRPCKRGWGSQQESIRKREMGRTSGRCEYCGGSGVMIHERWEYDDSAKVQCLVGFAVTCDKCSLVQHFGRAAQIGRENEALAHLMLVNRISQKEAEDQVERAFDDWEMRSKHDWRQYLSWLRARRSNYGLTEEDMAKAEQLLGIESWSSRCPKELNKQPGCV